MKVALDTNILVYAEGMDGEERQTKALSALAKLADQAVVVPAQVLGELFNVLTRKAQKSRKEASTALEQWGKAYTVAPTTGQTMLLAAELSSDHQLAIWDAVILTVASEFGCRVLLTQDMQDGFQWRGVTVVDPFK